jgi:hypothetical protein
MYWQWPTDPVWLQDTHGPLHATLQHTPSTQKPEAQSLLFSQDAPLELLPQLPAAHVWPFAHWASLVQRVAQRFFVLSQV